MFMRRYMLVFIFFVLTIPSYSQQKEIVSPDYTSIEKLTKDPNSAFYYPALFKRYKSDDTTLSFREYKMLYYSFFFQDGFSFSGNAVLEDSLNIYFAKDNLTKSDWQNVIRLSKGCLEKKPFELKKLNLVYYAAKNLGDQKQVRIYQDKIKKIAYAILSSGDGRTEETAMHVLQVSDEYSLINMLGYEYNGQRELKGDRCDYLTLKTNEDNISGLYFDLKQLFTQYEKMLSVTQAGK